MLKSDAEGHCLNINIWQVRSENVLGKLVFLKRFHRNHIFLPNRSDIYLTDNTPCYWEPLFCPDPACAVGCWLPWSWRSAPPHGSARTPRLQTSPPSPPAPDSVEPVLPLWSSRCTAEAPGRRPPCWAEGWRRWAEEEGAALRRTQRTTGWRTKTRGPPAREARTGPGWRSADWLGPPGLSEPDGARALCDRPAPDSEAADPPDWPSFPWCSAAAGWDGRERRLARAHGSSPFPPWSRTGVKYAICKSLLASKAKEINVSLTDISQPTTWYRHGVLNLLQNLMWSTYWKRGAENEHPSRHPSGSVLLMKCIMSVNLHVWTWHIFD